MPPHGSELDSAGSSSRSTLASPPGVSSPAEVTSSEGGQGAPAPERKLGRQASARTALAAPPSTEEFRVQEVALDVHNNSGSEDQRRTSLEGSRPILRTSIDRPREVEMRKLSKPRRSVSFHEEDDVQVIPERPRTYFVRFRREQGELISLAMPIVASQFLNFLLNMVDIAMVGHLGAFELAAAGLGIAYYNVFYYPLSGAAMALDTLLSQSYGAKQLTLYGDWLIISLVIMLILCVPCAVAILAAGPVLVGIGIEEELAEKSAEYIALLLPGLFPNMVFVLFTKYLQNQSILTPCVILALLSNIFNIVCNYLMIYASGIGFVGAPIATSITRIMQCAALFYYLQRSLPRHSQTWPKFSVASLKALSRDNCFKFLSFALPGCSMIALEAWAFEVTFFMVAFLGPIELDAHTALLNVTGFIYMSFPLALSIAASIRVGHLLGAGEADKAVVAAQVTVVHSVGFMAVLASIQYYFRYRIGWVFSNEPAVIALVASLVYIVALFAVADGLQSGLAGVFRGMGQQKIVVGLNLLGFWIIGLPVGVVLTFHEGGDWFGLQGEAGEGMGLPGVYWGLNFGLFSTGIIGTIVMSRMDWVEMARQARARVGAGGDAANGGSKEGDATSAIIKDDGCAAAASGEGSNECTGTGAESRDGMYKA